MKLTESQIQRLIRAIYSGEINIFNLPKKLYLAIASYLLKGLDLGWRKEITYFENNLDFLNELKLNTYLFSAAKTFNYVLATEQLMVKGDEIIPFSEFKEMAIEKYKIFNETWLETEYNTAIGQAQCAAKWKNIEEKADYMKYVTYRTVGDANVSDLCRSIDGVTKLVTDSFWDVYAPKNHYNCRCILKQTSDGVVTYTGKIETPPEGFRHNAGKNGQVFDKSHPYFQVQGYKHLAKENFGLPIPKL